MKFIAVVIQIYTRSGQTRLSCRPYIYDPAMRSRRAKKRHGDFFKAWPLRLKGCGGDELSGDSGTNFKTWVKLR